MVTFIYFDDTAHTAIRVKRTLERTEGLSIQYREDHPWRDTKRILLDEQPDGLILDWCLDGENNSRVDFSSEALAEQCRRLVSQPLNKEKFNHDFPIILCSSQPNFSLLHTNDTTSKDLFDLICTKEELAMKGELLKVLVEEYRKLNVQRSSGTRSVRNILGLSNSNKDKVNYDLIKKVSDIRERDTHEIIYFLTEELIMPKGALINENVLAARFGIDKQSEGWSDILDMVSQYKYSGIMDYHSRWWSELIDDWWETTFEGSTLKYLMASERISLLQNKYPVLSERLIKIELANGGSSEDYWTVCYGDKETPISELDGFVIDKHLHYSWQENEYICLDEAISEENRGIWKDLVPYELERLKKYNS